MSILDDEVKKDNKVQKIINNGAEIAGAAVGGALGFLAGDPGTAALLALGGGLAGKALKKIGIEISERLLGSREKTRVGAVIAIAANKIKERIEEGESIRDDDFFVVKKNGRTKADEVIENVIQKCQRDPEEKKIGYMGLLLANIAFDKSISVELAHIVIKTVEILTFRQICILSVAGGKEKEALRSVNYREEKEFPRELYQVLHECFDLYSRSLINFKGTAALGLTDVLPSAMTVQGVGVDMYNNLELYRMPLNEKLDIIKILV